MAARAEKGEHEVVEGAEAAFAHDGAEYRVVRVREYARREAMQDDAERIEIAGGCGRPTFEALRGDEGERSEGAGVPRSEVEEPDQARDGVERIG